MAEQFWMLFALIQPNGFPSLFELGGAKHGCPCSKCVIARREGKAPRDGHYCPCEACQKGRESHA